MQHISGGKYAGNGCLQGFIDHRSVRNAAHLCAEADRQFIFGKETHGQEQRVAVIVLFRSRNRFAVRTDFRDHDAFHTFLPLDPHYRVRELKRNAEVIQALHDVPLQAAGIRHQLGADQHPGAFQRHAPRHDETDVPGAQDDNPAAGQIALYIDQPLRCSRRKYTRRTETGYVQGAAASLAAAHGEDQGFGLQEKKPVLLIDRHDMLAAVLPLTDVHDHRVQLVFDFALVYLVGISLCVFGPGQLFLECMEAEAVVNALIEYTAEPVFSFEYEYASLSRIKGGHGCSEPGGPSSDDNQVIFRPFHGSSLKLCPLRGRRSLRSGHLT